MEETTIEYRVMAYDIDGLCTTYHYDNLKQSIEMYDLLVSRIKDEEVGYHEYIIVKRKVVEICNTTVMDSRNEQITKEK